MSQTFPKTLIVDVGKSWTKAFVVSISQNKLNVEKSLSLPTSLADISYTIKQLGTKLKVTADLETVITGALPEGEDFAKTIGAEYISLEDALPDFKKAATNLDFKDPVIFDAGDYDYTPNLKVDQLGAFLTSTVTEVEIENYLGNKSIKPQQIPVTKMDLEIEEAFFRFGFSRSSDFLKSRDLLNIVVSGSFFSRTPRQSHLALIILDILAKGRVAQVRLDKDLFFHSFCALYSKYPQVADVENDFLIDLGAFVSFGGEGNVSLDYGFSENQELKILEDEIALVPAHNNQKVQMTVISSRDKLKYKLSGGAFGILLDGRIKPLKLAYNSKESQEAMKRYLSAIDKLEMIG